jgi:hypothetical protein
MHTHRHLRNAALRCVAAIAAYAQPAISVSVNDPRPLANAAERLEQVLGVPINYEDAPYEHPADMTDVTSSVARNAPPNAKGLVMIPRGGALNVSVSAANKEAAAWALVNAHAAAGYPGDYKVESANGVLYIAPTLNPKLSSNISFPFQERSAAEALNLIVGGCSKAGGVKIGIGMAPLNALLMDRVMIGASNEPARDVLARLFAGMSHAGGSMFSYHVYFDPGLRYYMLNIHGVQPPNSPVTVLNGAAAGTPVTSSGGPVHFTPMK